MHAPASRSQAFSLIEVLLALGIVSFAFIALMSLLPVGLRTFRQADLMTTEAQIGRRVAGQLQLTGFTNVASHGSLTYYFTADGQPAQAAAAALYTVVTSVPSGLSLPASGRSAVSTNVLAVTLSITCKSAPLTTNVIPVYISNSGS